MVLVLIVGLAMNVVALPLAGRRVSWLYRLITSGQPAPDRIEGVTARTGAALKRQVVEVFGQKKLLAWSVPGAAHFFVFWAFIILATVYLEAYGSLLKLLFHGGTLPDGVALSWAIPVVGHWAVLGFLQDFIAMMAFFSILVFVWIRVKSAPKDLGRKSRFFGSHLSGAWITLFMIFNVIWTLYLFRGASAGLHTFPYKGGAYVSIGLGGLLDGIPHGGLEALEGIGLLLHIGVMLVFLIFVLNSKHLHIFVAPLNVMFGRPGVALGAAKPLMSDGKVITLEDLEDLDEDVKLGVGAAEDFTWKGLLDFNTCTECGRCQDQCPAWNTEKPLSPKLMIMALRDNAQARAPYMMAPADSRDALLEGNDTLTKAVERPLVGDTGDDWFYMPDSGAGVIDPDVLWSCVTCGACVQQCPVDIEHVDHIIDMRRYQVLVESNFPAELNQLFKGLESKGNPWNMSATARMDWAKDLPFDVKVVGEDIESLDEVDWLFWVGCAGAYEDRAKKTTRAVAELLDMAGVSFGVLGNGETCTGDSARRAGNEFVFQGLAAQNIETFQEYKVKKVVSTCAHCFNTLKNEYLELGIELEVVHHTQLLNRLVREKKLTPVAAQGGTRSVTYHDPCYIGRHNQVYEPPRELLEVIPDANFVEMPRNSERSFCCGAGGARMWMEETIGSRINDTRTKEAVETGADQIAVACPFCRVMLSDGLTSAQSKGEAREEVEVLDVAQMLLASVKGEAPAAKKATANGAATAKAAPVSEETKAEPEAGDVTQTEETLTATEDVGPAAESSGGGSSLFDLGDDSADDSGGDAPDSPEDDAAAAPGVASGGSLFDLGDDEPEDKTEDATAVAAPAQAEEKKESSGGSLFDIEESTEPEPSAKADEDPAGDSTADDSQEPVPSSGGTSTPSNTIPEGGSLFDIETPTEEPSPTAKTAPEPAAEKDKSDEDPAGDSTTDEDVDRTEDAADTSQEPESGPKPATKSAEPTSTQRSLFDIAAPSARTVATPQEPVTDEPEPEAAVESDEDSAEEAEAKPAEPDSGEPAMKTFAQIKAEHSGDPDSSDSPAAGPEETEGDAAEPGDDESAPEPGTQSDTAEDAEDENPKPVSSGDAHTPKTDADIGEAGSLFDL